MTTPKARAAALVDAQGDIEKTDRIHRWFELSYAQYLTVPRSVLRSMPDEWQDRFVTCLEELDETIDWRPKSGRYWVQLKDGKGHYTSDPFMQYRHAPPVPWRDGMMPFREAIETAERNAMAEQRPWSIVPKGADRYVPKARADLQEGEWSVFDADPKDLPEVTS